MIASYQARLGRVLIRLAYMLALVMGFGALNRPLAELAEFEPLKSAMVVGVMLLGAWLLRYRWNGRWPLPQSDGLADQAIAAEASSEQP